MSVDWGTFIGLLRGSVMLTATTFEFMYHSIKDSRKRKVPPKRSPLWYC